VKVAGLGPGAVGGVLAVGLVRAGVPVVWQIHSVVSEPMMSPAAVRLMRWLARWLPDRIVCNSKATAACFSGLGDRVRIVACGADTSRYSGNGRRPGVSRVGMIARFSPLKGQRVFVEAANQITADRPETEFILAGAPLFGEDQYADQVRQDCLTSPNPERFQLLAFVDDDAVVDSGWYCALTARWDEAPADVACIGGPIRPRFSAPPPPWVSCSPT